MLSSKQFYIMLIIGVISMKMQKLPGLVYGELGAHGYILFLIYMLINLLLIVFVFFIIKKLKTENILKSHKSFVFECSIGFTIVKYSTALSPKPNLLYAIIAHIAACVYCPPFSLIPGGYDLIYPGFTLDFSNGGSNNLIILFSLNSV